MDHVLYDVGAHCIKKNLFTMKNKVTIENADVQSAPSKHLKINHFKEGQKSNIYGDGNKVKKYV